MTNEEAWLAKALFVAKIGATAGVMVDPIGPIKMKSRTEWLLGTQAAPNYRGVSAALGVGSGELGVGANSSQDSASSSNTPHPTPLIDNLLTNGADGIDVLFVTDAMFSERASDPAVVANLRKAKFLVVMSWDANHPLNDVADVLLPSTIHVEKEGTFTNLQGRVQRIHQAYPPKGQAVTDLELYRRIGAMLYSDAAEFRDFDHIPEFEPAAETAGAQA
jgi:anaerobic selenocysteine-containing dehydrogenase